MPVYVMPLTGEMEWIRWCAPARVLRAEDLARERNRNFANSVNPAYASRGRVELTSDQPALIQHVERERERGRKGHRNIKHIVHIAMKLNFKRSAFVIKSLLPHDGNLVPRSMYLCRRYVCPSRNVIYAFTYKSLSLSLNIYDAETQK